MRVDAILIATPDPAALAAFYREAFEWEPPDHDEPDLVGFKLENTYVGFEKGEATAPSPTTIWFRADDLEARFERLVAMGATIRMQPDANCSPGEVLAVVVDPEGNALGLIRAGILREEP